MHYFSGKGCFEFLESMHYCIGILKSFFKMLKEEFEKEVTDKKDFVEYCEL